MAIEQLYAVLMALNQDSLLLPNAAVVEVVSRDRVEAAAAGSPAWLIGWTPYNGRRLAVVSFETLNGAALPAENRRGRIVIVNSLGTHLDGGQFALLVQGYPHLVTLNRTAVQPASLRETDRADLVLSRVRIASHEAAIPDLSAIEADLVRSQPGV